MTNRFLTVRLLWLLAASLAFAGVLFGQATDSTIVGRVTDATGAAVPKAAIVATNRETGVKYNSTTNSAGEYRLNNVPVGHYDVSATAQGFSTTTVGNVQLELNHTASVNLALTVGSVATTVEVSEASALIDTSTAQLQSTFTTMQATDLPSAATSKIIGGAGIYNLSLIGAGVASSGGVGQGTGPSVSGQRPEANGFNIDGVGNDDHYGTGPQMYVSNEAIQQFNLVQNQFSAEYGAASGGVFNAIVKNGTNSLHGSIYEYMQNRDLNAVDASVTHQGLTSNPRFDDNRFGATVGGPIIKDKLFYFGNFEYSPLGQASSPGQAVQAPTAAGLSVLNGLSGISSTNLGVFEKYVPVAPVANEPPITVLGKSVPIGDLSLASPSYANSYNAVVAVDYNMSAKDQIRGRFIYANTQQIDTNANLPVFYEPEPNVSHSGSFSEFHNFSPTMENELRVSFSRNNQSVGAGNFAFPGLNVFPNLAFDDLNLQVGPDPNTPSGYIENKFQVQENLTKSWGKHTFKAGYNMTDVILTGYFVQRVRGDYDYASLQQYLTDGSPTGGSLSGVSGERDAGSSDVPFGFVEHAAYFQDDFRVTPNLTLNLGVRYEYVTIPVGSRYQANSAIATLPGVLTFASPKSNPNEWSPRLGFAWSPGKDGKWSIRGGAARSFYNTYINLNQNASPPYFATTVDVNANVSSPNFLKNGGLVPSLVGGTPTVADARGEIASYTFDQTRPYALTGTLGVQRLLGKDYTVEVRYVYTKGVHLWNQTRLNIVPSVTAANSLPTYLTAPSASTFASLKQTLGQLEAIPTNDLAQYGFSNAIVGYHPWGNSRYNGLQMQMTKRYSQNFSYVAAYTWSHNFDDSTATNFSTILSPRRAQNFQNMAAEWASSALDRRHRITLTPIYDIKPFDNKGYLLKNVVGNWNASGTLTLQSPEYATIQSGIDSNLSNDTAGNRSIVNPEGVANTGSGVTGYNAAGQKVAAGSSSIVAYVANNSNAQYILAGLGTLPNAGRNTFPLQGITNVDFSLLKRLNFKERFKFEAGAQFFNLFNHAQFVGGYISDVSYYQTNAISRNFLIPGNSSFGQYQQFFPSNARTMQLVARFVF